jgi:hypothetical protein
VILEVTWGVSDVTWVSDMAAVHEEGLAKLHVHVGQCDLAVLAAGLQQRHPRCLSSVQDEGVAQHSDVGV